ncbi:hypothetical protein GCM10017621_32930 [Maricaulis virginensis]|uniref:Uncharacterized protein n=1 Tax=Maricaulis virginensis TaxID=144022 RepID=A0A9W6MPM6_9PROT|nr:hypothetical protein GCM10017621_32930 [Maricaulis virginensis]
MFQTAGLASRLSPDRGEVRAQRGVRGAPARAPLKTLCLAAFAAAPHPALRATFSPAGEKKVVAQATSHI